MKPTPKLPHGLARPALAGVDVYEPGRPVDDVRRELGVESVIRLASNEGPFPPMPGAVAAICEAAEGLRVYPDAGAWALRDAIAARTGLEAAQVLPGAGVDGLIRLMCLALLDPGDELAMAWPSFLSWRMGAQVQGATLRMAPLAADGAYDLDALLAQVTPRTKLAVVVSPNNPTGGAVAAADLERFLDALPGHVLPVVDEAYFEYLPAGGHDAGRLVAEGRALGVMRTFSKAFGLAGLRVGYLLGPPDLVRALGRGAQRLRRQRARAGGGHREPGRGRRAAARAHRAERDRAGDDGGRYARAGPRAAAQRGELPAGRPGEPGAGPGRQRRAARARGHRPAGAGLRRPSALRVTVGFPEENARFLDAAAGALAEAA